MHHSTQAIRDFAEFQRSEGALTSSTRNLPSAARSESYNRVMRALWNAEWNENRWTDLENQAKIYCKPGPFDEEAWAAFLASPEGTRSRELREMVKEWEEERKSSRSGHFPRHEAYSFLQNARTSGRTRSALQTSKRQLLSCCKRFR